MKASAARLNALSPLATLARGYAVARDASGRALTSAAQFAPGSVFDLLLHDGRVAAEARSVSLPDIAAEETPARRGARKTGK
jgi:exodeoxyribonuclease VII large subunit